MEWKAEWTLAILPIVAAILATLIFSAAGASAATSQWAAIITFLVLLPFCLARLFERGR